MGPMHEELPLMLIHALVIAALVVAARSLWVRRATWRCKWDAALTYSVSLQWVSVALCAPAQTSWLGRLVHDRAGLPHFDDWLGYTCCLLALYVLIESVCSRLTGVEHIAHIAQLVALGAAAGIFVCTALSPQLATYPDAVIATVPVDFWLGLQGHIYAAAVCYLAGTYLWLLMVLRDLAPGCRVGWFIATAACMVASGVAVFVWEAIPSQRAAINVLVWATSAAAIMLCSIGAARAWRARLAPFHKLLAAVGSGTL